MPAAGPTVECEHRIAFSKHSIAAEVLHLFTERPSIGPFCAYRLIVKRGTNCAWVVFCLYIIVRVLSICYIYSYVVLLV